MEEVVQQPEPEETKKEKDKGPGKKELTLDRARLAQERTLLAWVRTATTFMTFGFALFKFLEVQLQQVQHAPILEVVTPRMIGVSMLLAGLIGLILAMFRYFGSMKILNHYSKKKFFTPALLQGYLVIILILILLYGSIPK